jgi:hypothetical protein
MKNKASDVHNILMESLERLNDLDDDDMKGEKLTKEIQRADAINKVASQLISNGRLVLDAIRVKVESPEVFDMPDMLTFINTQKVLPAPDKKK